MLEGFRATSENFQGLGDLERGDQVDDGTEDADGVACFFEAESASGIEEAGEAGGFPGANDHGDAIAADRRGVNPGQAEFHCEIVEQEAGFEIIGAIEQEWEAGEQLGGILGVKVRDDALHADAGIDGAQAALSGHGFGEGIAGVGLFEKGLPLEVGGFDEVAVDDAQFADPGADEKVGSRGADGSATDDDGAGSGEAFLAVGADAREEHLAGVFFMQRMGHVG